jgi:hypothetical protein
LDASTFENFCDAGPAYRDSRTEFAIALPIPKVAVNARQQLTASAEIPIASDTQLRHSSRGFLPGFPGLR